MFIRPQDIILVTAETEADGLRVIHSSKMNMAFKHLKQNM